MRSGRYLTLVPLIVLAAFTRPGAIALPVVLALQLAVEWRATRRRPEHLARAGVALVVGGAACLAWPPIADLVTGHRGAYLQTELSWWTGWVGRPAFVPFTPWFLITSRWLGPAGVLLAVVLFGAVVVWLLRGSPKALGVTIRGFRAVHLLYLVAVFLPQFSLPRLLMPLAPLLGASAFTGTPTRSRAWLVVAAASQPVCVVLLWFLSYP